MPSESKQARETQKQHFQVAIDARRNLLADKGVDKDRIAKDPHLKHLKAKLRKASKRLSVLGSLEKKKEDMALAKQQKLEAKTSEKPADAPKESKKKQKKEKKKKKED
jgi:hypothetical protein